MPKKPAAKPTPAPAGDAVGSVVVLKEGARGKKGAIVRLPEAEIGPAVAAGDVRRATIQDFEVAGVIPAA